MGFEGFLGKRSAEKNGADESSQETDELLDPSKRRFIKGAAAVAGALAMPSVIRADEASSEITKESNLERIEVYQQRLLLGRPVLDNFNAEHEHIWGVVRPYGAFEPSLIKGTRYDHEDWFRNGCTNNSWPSVQVRVSADGKSVLQRWGHEPNIEDGTSSSVGNGFYINKQDFITNRHVIQYRQECEIAPYDLDIASCSVYEGGLRSDRVAKDAIERSTLRTDRRMRTTDIHGEVIHIPTIHEKRGRESDNTDVTSGVAIKVTQSMIDRLKLALTPVEIPNPHMEGGKELIDITQRMLNSYMCFIPSRPSATPRGMSGSPVLLDSLCGKDGQNLVGGILWGTTEKGITDPYRKVTYDVCYIHGPREIIAMTDAANTLISANLSEAVAPNKMHLTRAVQDALRFRGFNEISVDGVYGPQTSQIIEEYQRRTFSQYEFESTIIPGVIDRRTYGALFPQAANISKTELYSLLAA